MRLAPCRFNLPLTDNLGQPIAPEVIVELHRKLLGQFGGFTVHAPSQGRWLSREGRVYQEQVAVYEVAVPEDKVPLLREVVRHLGQQIGQLAMYFDAPPPSVEIIDLSGSSDSASLAGGSSDVPRPGKTTRRRSKKNRPPG